MPNVQTTKCERCGLEFTAGAPTLREAMENLFVSLSEHTEAAHSTVAKKKQSLADRIRAACQLSFDGNPKAIRSHLHGLRINLRNLATEAEKLEKEVAELREETIVKEGEMHVDYERR